VDPGTHSCDKDLMSVPSTCFLTVADRIFGSTINTFLCFGCLCIDSFLEASMEGQDRRQSLASFTIIKHPTVGLGWVSVEVWFSW